MILEAPTGLRQFEFGRDTFAYANELRWNYNTGEEMSPGAHGPRSAGRAYTHHCFVMVRAARQFFHHARFDASQAVISESEYCKLIRRISAQNPRLSARETGRIVIPGYESLYRFSEERGDLLKAHCGGAWQSYVLRSHWRMVFPTSRGHQQNMASQLTRSLDKRGAAVVHIFRFPQLTINHGILLYRWARTAEGISFSAYDPNVPVRPTVLTYHENECAFTLPRNHYWAGGPVQVVETYCNWLY